MQRSFYLKWKTNYENFWNNETNVRTWICKVENKNELIIKYQENWKNSFFGLVFFWTEIKKCNLKYLGWLSHRWTGRSEEYPPKRVFWNTSERKKIITFLQQIVAIGTSSSKNLISRCWKFLLHSDTITAH